MEPPLPIDFHYRPTDEGFAWLSAFAPTRALHLGVKNRAALEGLADSGASVRLRSDNPWQLPRGIYSMRIRSEWVALAVSVGGDERPPIATRLNELADSLGNARSVFEAAWDAAVDHSGRCQFRVDDLVRIVGEASTSRVTKVTLRETGYEIELVNNHGKASYAEADLERADGDPDAEETWIKQAPAGAADIGFTLTWTKLKHPLTDTVYSYASSKTIFRPYQFLPVLKILNSPSGRLLIADEVGLGKTIEAGLIWSELEQRTRLERVLVVTPAALTLKWQSEMERRFDRRLSLLKLADFREFADRLEAGEDPGLSGIISINALRRDGELLQRLADLWPRLDLVIVDEAHAMRNEKTSSNMLGQLLADWSDYLVFLSATPLNLGQQDLFNLLTMLDEGQFDDAGTFRAQIEPNAILNSISRSLISLPPVPPRTLLTSLQKVAHLDLGRSLTQRPDYKSLEAMLDSDADVLPASDIARARRHLSELNTLSSVFTRTRKRDIPDKKALREAVQVDVDWTDEERNFYDAITQIYRRRALSTNQVPGFAMQMPLRMAASCIPAMQRHFRERRPDLDIDDRDDETEGGHVDESLEAEVMTALHPVMGDSKFDALHDKLAALRAQGMRQVMIFSFFRGTLAYLEKRLSADMSVRVMHGRVPVADRQQIMDDFRADKFDVLLLSQVGSEGLDFEFCNILVNYDMPWNPMQVEQRIGRLDRFGQQHDKIFILNMHIAGTIETEIFTRLYHRIGLFKDSVGDLEPILRDEMQHINKALDPRLSPAQKREMLSQIEVAIEKRGVDAQHIDESQGVLAYADQLRIEGLSEDGPTGGRFVGQHELRSLIERLCALTDARLTQPDTNGVATLVGSPSLAERLRSMPRQSRIGALSPAKLATQFQDRVPVPVTFDTDVASRSEIELLSARHPLVSLALHYLEPNAATFSRFGAVRVPELPEGSHHVARIDLITTTGIRPQLELWVTAMTLPNLEPADEVEVALLRALAHGGLLDVREAPTQVTPDHLNRLGDLAFNRRTLAGANRRADNDALVDARIEARLHSIAVKKSRASAMLGKAWEGSPDPRIVRLHEGRIRNLAAEGAAIRAELEAKRGCRVSGDQVAIIYVEGGGLVTDRR